MRRVSRTFAVLFLLCASVAIGGQRTSTTERVLLREDISSYAGPGSILTVRELELPPSAQGEKHRHPGPVVACVLQGTLEIALQGQGPKTYGAGECFSEKPHQLHLYSRNLSKTKPVRLISYILNRNGEPLTTPEK